MEGAHLSGFRGLGDQDGTELIMQGDVAEPLNLGSSELVSIDQLVGVMEEIAGIRLARRYDLGAPRGVDGRNSDNTLIRERLGWEPSIALRTGLEQTYRWIYDQIQRAHPLGADDARLGGAAPERFVA